MYGAPRSGVLDKSDNSQGIETAFAEALASFLKASFVYPENNVRVQDALSDCVKTLASLSGREQRASVRIAGPKVSSAGVAVEPPLTPLVEWMKETFEATALAGVEFDDHLEADAFLALARRLRTNFTVKVRHPSFRQMWSEEVPGLRFVEPRFRGRFAAKYGEDTDFPDATAAETTGRFGDSIHSHPGVASQLHALQQVLDTETSGTLQEADIVSQIVNLLPEQVRNNPAALVKTVETILRRTTDQLAGKAGEPIDEDLDYRQLVLRVCRTFFVHEAGEGEKKEEVDEEQPKGHAGDEKFTDDLDAFLREVAELPPPLLRIDLEESPAEQLGVCLHQLFTADDEDHVRNVQPRVVELLNDTDPDRLGLVKQTIGLITEPSTETTKADRLLKLLRQEQFAHILRSSLVLPTDFVAATFPSQFCLFLDSLDPEDTSAQQRLDEVLARLPRRIIVAKSKALIDDGVDEPARVQVILGHPTTERLPLLELLLLHGDRLHRDEIIQFLRKLDFDTPAAAALSLPEDYLPDTFVTAMIRNDKRDDAGTRKVAINLLKSFAETPAQDDEVTARQVLAVNALQKLWSPDTEAFLQKLSRRGLRVRAIAAKPVREAARAILRRKGI